MRGHLSERHANTCPLTRPFRPTSPSGRGNSRGGKTVSAPIAVFPSPDVRWHYGLDCQIESIAVRFNPELISCGGAQLLNLSFRLKRSGRPEPSTHRFSFFLKSRATGRTGSRSCRLCGKPGRQIRGSKSVSRFGVGRDVCRFLYVNDGFPYSAVMPWLDHGIHAAPLPVTISVIGERQWHGLPDHVWQ